MSESQSWDTVSTDRETETTQDIRTAPWRRQSHWQGHQHGCHFCLPAAPQSDNVHLQSDSNNKQVQEQMTTATRSNPR